MNKGLKRRVAEANARCNSLGMRLGEQSNVTLINDLSTALTAKEAECERLREFISREFISLAREINFNGNILPPAWFDEALKETENEHTPEQLKVMQNDIIQAAIKWWSSRRPVSWRQEQHLENPTVNTVGAAEKELAEAVARRALAEELLEVTHD